MNILQRYYYWLHGQWPSGLVEKLPIVGEHGLTNISGIRVIGDLSGIPLLKFSSETGSRAIHSILAEPNFSEQRNNSASEVYDVAIIGGGVSGYSAALEAKKAGLNYVLIEASASFSTIRNFPKAKPIFTYPTEMRPSGGLQYDNPENSIKEGLLDDLLKQVESANIITTFGHIEKIERDKSLFVLNNTANASESWKALRVVVAIGRSGDFRKLGVTGEELDKVTNRLHDPKVYTNKDVLIVGGGDSAAEAAIALSEAGAKVSLSYRKPELTRPKPENIRTIYTLEKQGLVKLLLSSAPIAIDSTSVTLTVRGEALTIANDSVFTLIGRNPPLAFFRKSKLDIAGDKNSRWWTTLFISVIFFTWLYHWKKGLVGGLDPAPAVSWLMSGVKEITDDSSSFLHTLKESASKRGFYYTLAYCLMVTIFGARRIKRRNTPYVTKQTITLVLIQWIPLFILPELVLPYLGANGTFDAGIGKWVADTFFPNGSYWRSYGFIFAWPLSVYNWFTSAPIWGWIILGFIQTFVIIPLIIIRWGKGAYCGWICSCGALAETVGDTHRHKMPHGPKATRWNIIGQVFLAFATVIMLLRIIGWAVPSSGLGGTSEYLFNDLPLFNYAYLVDLIFSGIIGVAFYTHYSGRVWCRFACPLAALMHVYARFTKFRIFADKSKCISCNVCTSVCHQGIDIMNFANKGLAMEDPQCVRCSACVQQCPTGVLSFGRIGENGVQFLDTLPASTVQLRELELRKQTK